ncbi:MAG: integrase arm-type DNA-binding domain-containing protein [Hyphomicrobium sp.]|nr:integrase arm-type DNA-binding domain-containing protein [Hyphomicrobium sp.]
MASRTTKIGPAVVAAMGSDEIIWDSELSRFGVRSRRGTKSYFIKVRIDGRQRWVNLGRHGPITASEARAKARQVLADVDRGQDPTRDRERAKTIPLFGDFAEKWLREHVGIKRKPNTYREYKRIVERNLGPALRKVRIDRVERADALSIHASLSHQPYVGNRVIAVLSAIMTFAEKLGHRPPFSNPCRGNGEAEARHFSHVPRKMSSSVGACIARRTAGLPYVVGSVRKEKDQGERLVARNPRLSSNQDGDRPTKRRWHRLDRTRITRLDPNFAWSGRWWQVLFKPRATYGIPRRTWQPSDGRLCPPRPARVVKRAGP